jgi:PAS domain S-box-containing protein
MGKGKKVIESTATEMQFKALIQNAHDGIVLYNSEGKIKFASHSVKKVAGYTEKELLGKGGSHFIHPGDVEETRNAFFELLKTPGKSITLFQRIRHKNGHYIWSESLLTNFLHVPAINGIVSNFRDITERKIAEQKIKETQELLEAINRNVSEGIFMGILGVKFVYANEAFLEISGYKTFKELEGIKPGDFYVNSSQHEMLVGYLRKTKELKNIEALMKRKDGRQVLVRMTIRLVSHDGNDDYFVGSVMDISKEKAAANELIESRNFLDNIINTVAAPIFVKDSKHRWIKFNNSFCDLLKQSPEEILGKTDKHFLRPAEAKVFWAIDNQVLENGQTVFNEERITDNNGNAHDLITVKSRYVNDHGEKFIIGFITEITSIKRTEEEISQLNANLQGVMESTKESIFSIDSRYNYTAYNSNHKKVMKLLYGCNIEVGTNKLKCIKGSKDEKWLKADLQSAMRGSHFVVERHLDYPQYHNRMIQLVYNPVRNEKGEVKGVAVFVSDITDRRTVEAQLKALNEELREQNWQLAMREEELKAAMEELSERNFELDQLMYKTSHDLRSPLSSIMGLVNLANIDKDTASRDQYLSKIDGRIRKLDDFIRSMLNYARVNRADVALTEINIKDLVYSSIRELDHLDNFKSIKTTVDIKGENTPFRSDELRVKIIFSNIISNAYKYYNGDVKSYLKIKIEITPLTLNIEFKDNGIGIKKEHLDKIYNMFYRATDRSQGSGLGMYIVKQAVERLRGTINLKSEYGRGTTIKITLPNQ